jgi:hypothetical protein
VSSCDLHQNHCTGILTLLKDVNEIVVFFILVKIWYKRHPHKFIGLLWVLWKLEQWKHYFTGVKEFIFVHSAFLVRLWWHFVFKCSAHNDVGSVLQVSWKSVQWSPYFFCGHDWNYIYMCAVKQYYMLDVKNTLVKSFVLCHRVHHLQHCVLTEEHHRDVAAKLELKV